MISYNPKDWITSVLIVEAIENPFDTGTNNLPTDNIAKTIRTNLKELL